MEPLLNVSGLSVDYHAARGEVVHALENIDLELNSQETLGILGESGSGKSSLALALLRLLPANAGMVAGQVAFQGRQLPALSERELRNIRGSQISLIFQEPALALNPVLPVGRQIADVLTAHRRLTRSEAARETTGILIKVGFPEPERILRAYPHQLSGGQRQRIAIAQALVCRPSILIADEPLSSLDTITQAEILDLLRKLKQELKLSIIFITHHAGVLSSLADRAIVMRQGKIICSGSWQELWSAPDAYVQELIRPARPITSTPAAAGSSNGNQPPLLEVRSVSRRFAQKRLFSKKFQVQALKDVNLAIRPHEIVALVGRSGSGKSTLARCLAGFETPDSGEALVDGKPVGSLTREARQQVQLLFQDAATSLNPGFTAAQLIAEPLEILRRGTAAERKARVAVLMQETGLEEQMQYRRTREFSGGQKQRLALARALAAEPRLLIMDEALSGLDLPLQAQMIRLLLELQSRHGLAYLYISHDLNFVSLFAHRVLVMDQGEIVEEIAPLELEHCRHPQTRALFEASQKLHAPGVEVSS